MEYALQVENLCKCYKNTGFALQGVSLAIPQGTIMGFVGQNGAGKSTTINTMLNIAHKDSGTVKFFGREMTDADTAMRDDIGVVFDSANFQGELTPQKLEKVLSAIYANWDAPLFWRWLERFGIEKNKKIKTFSRGMSMKLSISVALSHKAKLLILDEATAGLDPVVREEILDVFLEFVEDEKNTILLSSHISSDLEKIADYITFIHGGRILLTESKDTLLYQYGIARCKRSEFEGLDRAEYLACRERGLQLELLLPDKAAFAKKHPTLTVDNATIDEILPLIVREENGYEGLTQK